MRPSPGASPCTGSVALSRGGERTPGACSYTGSVSGGTCESLVPPLHAEAHLSHGGQEPGTSSYTGRVSLSRGGERKQGASLYTQKRRSLTGGRATARCLLVHAEGSVGLYIVGARAKALAVVPLCTQTLTPRHPRRRPAPAAPAPAGVRGAHVHGELPQDRPQVQRWGGAG